MHRENLHWLLHILLYFMKKNGKLSARKSLHSTCLWRHRESNLLFCIKSGTKYLQRKSMYDHLKWFVMPTKLSNLCYPSKIIYWTQVLANWLNVTVIQTNNIPSDNLPRCLVKLPKPPNETGDWMPLASPNCREWISDACISFVLCP